MKDMKDFFLLLDPILCDSQDPQKHNQSMIADLCMNNSAITYWISKQNNINYCLSNLVSAARVSLKDCSGTLVPHFGHLCGTLRFPHYIV